MPIFTVDRLDDENHWRFLAAFVDRLDLVTFIARNRHRTRIMCGTRLILDLHKHVPNTMTDFSLSTLVYDMTEPLVPVAS